MIGQANVGDKVSISRHGRSPEARASPQGRPAIRLLKPRLVSSSGERAGAAGDIVDGRLPTAPGQWDQIQGSVIEPCQPGVVLIHPQSLTRDGLGFWLTASLKEFSVRAAASPEEAAVLVDDMHNVVLVLYYFSSQRVSNFSLAQELASLMARIPDVPVAVLADDEDLEAILMALRSGARGYISTSLRAAAAIEAVKLVCAGELYAPTSSFLEAIERVSDRQERPPAQDVSAGDVVSKMPDEEERPRTQEIVCRFTSRQLEILRCLRRGIPNKCIAYELSMSQGTVKVHIRNIMKKLGARNRVQVVIMTNHLPNEEQLG